MKDPNKVCLFCARPYDVTNTGIDIDRRFRSIRLMFYVLILTMSLPPVLATQCASSNVEDKSLWAVAFLGAVIFNFVLAAIIGFKQSQNSIAIKAMVGKVPKRK